MIKIKITTIETRESFIDVDVDNKATAITEVKRAIELVGISNIVKNEKVTEAKYLIDGLNYDDIDS